MKRIQLFVHRHYETIKLAMLVILVMLCGFIVTAQIIENDTRSKNRTAAVAEVAEAVKRETELQTDIINRQFRAICILIIETSGQAGLNKLDTESRERCENLDVIEEAVSTKQTAEPAPQRNLRSTSSSSSSQNTPRQPRTQLDISQTTQPQPSLVESVVNGLQGVINNVLNIL